MKLIKLPFIILFMLMASTFLLIYFILLGMFETYKTILYIIKSYERSEILDEGFVKSLEEK